MTTTFCTRDIVFVMYMFSHFIMYMFSHLIYPSNGRIQDVRMVYIVCADVNAPLYSTMRIFWYFMDPSHGELATQLRHNSSLLCTIHIYHAEIRQDIYRIHIQYNIICI